MSIIPRKHYGHRYEPPPPAPRVQIWDHPSSLTSTHMGFPMMEASGQIEWKESPEAHIFKAHMHGLRPEEVRVEVEEEERVVCITGEKRVEMREEKKGMWHRIERSSGRMVQRLRLPENGRVREVKAYMDDGVLTITVPKYEVANNYHHGRRPRLINISGH